MVNPASSVRGPKHVVKTGKTPVLSAKENGVTSTGETLVVTRIDRLARSMRDFQIIIATLKDQGAHLAATEQPVDTSTAAGKAFFDMLGVIAEFETNLRRERQAKGIGATKQRGAYRGRASLRTRARRPAPRGAFRTRTASTPGAPRDRKGPTHWQSFAPP